MLEAYLRGLTEKVAEKRPRAFIDGILLPLLFHFGRLYLEPIDWTFLIGSICFFKDSKNPSIESLIEVLNESGMIYLLR
jgi:hypothetical protein